MKGPLKSWKVLACLTGLIFVMFTSLSQAGQPSGSSSRLLRVCADPNNLPFSNAAQQGFENKLAALLAGDLDMQLHYAWWAQRRGFIRNTLKANKCDVIMGVPVGLPGMTQTEPYYRSGYVFVSRAGRFPGLQSITDQRLRNLKIGVPLIGDDGTNTPPQHALAMQGVTTGLKGFPIYGDYRQPNPPARPVQAVAAGDIDVASVWGPVGGYFARQAEVPLEVVPIAGGDAFAPLTFHFDIAIGLRKQDGELKQNIDAILHRRRSEICALLTGYGVPLLGPQCASSQSAHRH